MRRYRLPGRRSAAVLTPTMAASEPHRNFRTLLLSTDFCGTGAPPPTVMNLMSKPLHLLSLTLTRMAEGGLYDQLGGGFCRYSVDRQWQIPHFEKMLYDNGPLLSLYAEASLATGETLFSRVANETADWMLTDMLAPGGGFYSTRDADSEGEEGLYYVWTPATAKALLSDEEFAVAGAYFGLTEEANFEGQWHLTIRESTESIGSRTNRSSEEVATVINRAREKLLRGRASRIAPDRDEKQLTAWNALAIAGFSTCGSALQRVDLIDAAEQSAIFIEQNLLIDGRLFASFKDGRARFPAYLDDHAFLLDALLKLLQSRWNGKFLAFAQTLAELLLTHFYDPAGGFYFTANDHETLMHRPKALADDATPSGNGVAALALQRLGFLLGRRATWMPRRKRCRTRGRQ